MAGSSLNPMPARSSINPGVSMKTRILAFLLDYVLIMIYGAFLGILFLLFQPFFQSLYSQSVYTADFTSFILIILPVILYFSLCEGSRRQATWGKSKLGLRVTDSKGNRIGYGRSFLRTVLKFIAWEPAHFAIFRLTLQSEDGQSYLMWILGFVYFVVFLYFISPFFNKRRRSIYDLAAGTAVVTD